jgi:heat shock protein HslJ
MGGNRSGVDGVWTPVKRTIASLALAIMLTACAYAGSGNGNGNGSGPASQSANPSDPGTPAGSWNLTKGTDASGEIPVLDDHPITLVIDADKAGGHAACNIYGGTVTIDGDSIRLAAMSMTEMACLDERAMNAEAAYMSALAAVTKWSRDGDRLVLSGEDVELTFTAQPPVPDAQLVGTTWVLDTLMQGDAASTVQGEATLTFATDGRFRGSTGCHVLAGSYQVSGDSIDFSNVTQTGDCSDELQGQDALVIDVLAGHDSATIDGPILTLLAQGQQGLGFHAAQSIE